MMREAIEALRLFRCGHDTVTIAKMTGAREADVCDRVHAARRAEKFGGREKEAKTG